MQKAPQGVFKTDLGEQNAVQICQTYGQFLFSYAFGKVWKCLILKMAL